MNFRTLPLLLVIVGTTPLLDRAHAEPPTSPTALDAARILVEQQGQLTRETIAALFGTAFAANMKVPPEHLGVAFYDQRTGNHLEPEEIRALMGGIRQDGAYELLDMVVPLLQGSVGLEVDQLRRLLDAAYIASMRRPPEHIDIEFYDRRTGPTGQGDGPSGRTPPRMHREEPAPTPSGGEESTNGEPQTTAEELPPQLPRDKTALRDKLRSLGFQVEARPGTLLFPIIAWAREGEDLQAPLRQTMAELEASGLTFHEFATEPVADHGDGWVVVYGLGFFSTDDAELRQELEAFMEGLHGEAP